jgi:hypothetical protein
MLATIAAQVSPSTGLIRIPADRFCEKVQQLRDCRFYNVRPDKNLQPAEHPRQ